MTSDEARGVKELSQALAEAIPLNGDIGIATDFAYIGAVLGKASEASDAFRLLIPPETETDFETLANLKALLRTLLFKGGIILSYVDGLLGTPSTGRRMNVDIGN